MRVVAVPVALLYVAVTGCLAASASPLLAQVSAGAITGIVRDQAGATVPGVTVTVTNIDTNRQRIVFSSADGLYAAPSLPPGQYRVEVELRGFKPMRREGIRLATGETARVDLELAVGEVRERVTVTADATVLRAETARIGI